LSTEETEKICVSHVAVNDKSVTSCGARRVDIHRH
jgi:hypothetical protein